MCIRSRYLMIATPATVLRRFFWNFTGVLIMVWRYACVFCFSLSSNYYIFLFFFFFFYVFPCCELSRFGLPVQSQLAHYIKMTSYQRRCDVITSHRRWYDVILTLCAHWGVYIAWLVCELLLHVSTDIFETLHTFSTCSEDLHVV